jgi:hypothetical protein
MNNSTLNSIARAYGYSDSETLSNEACINYIASVYGASDEYNINAGLNYICDSLGSGAEDFNTYYALNYITDTLGNTDETSIDASLDYWNNYFLTMDYGLKFDGVNDSVLVTNTASLNLINPEFTMAFTFNPSTILTLQNICSKGVAAARLYNVTLNGNVLVFGYGTGFSAADYYIQIPYTTPNVTKQIVWVKPDNNATNGQIYVDGVLTPHTVISNTLVTILAGNNGRTMIGDFPDGYFAGVAPFNGIMYDLKIFNTDLQGDNLTDIFDGIINPAVQANCVLNIPFSDKEGYVALDLTSNNNDGALSNYTLADVTKGVSNKWVDKNGNPVTF